MTPRTKIIAATVFGLGLALGMATVASAQVSAVAAAISSGQVGEQADGYLGVRGSVDAAVHQAVEAINIKRRAGYTTLAGQKGVTVKEIAAAVGCKTLATHVAPGAAYMLPDGQWHVREGSAPIALPDYCAS